MIRRGQFDASQAFVDAWDARDRSVAEHPGVREMVRFTQNLQRSASVEPTEEFRLELRAQLMAEAEQILVASAPRQARTPVITVSQPRRRIVALAAAAVSTFAVVGTAATSASALPGDMMYPIKRGLENVNLALHRDSASRGDFQLQQARERLAEAVTLQQSGETEHLANSLEDFAEQARAGSDDLFAAYAEGGSSAEIEKINQFVATASVTLAEMSADLPSGVTEEFQGAASLVADVASEASGLCPTCAPGDVADIITSIESLVGATQQPVANTDTDTGTESGADQPAGEAAPTAEAPVPSVPAPTSAPNRLPNIQVPTTTPPTIEDLVDSIIRPEDDKPLGGLFGRGN